MKSWTLIRAVIQEPTRLIISRQHRRASDEEDKPQSPYAWRNARHGLVYFHAGRIYSDE
jgi:hypothetical protein